MSDLPPTRAQLLAMLGALAEARGETPNEALLRAVRAEFRLDGVPFRVPDDEEPKNLRIAVDGDSG